MKDDELFQEIQNLLSSSVPEKPDGLEFREIYNLVNEKGHSLGEFRLRRALRSGVAAGSIKCESVLRKNIMGTFSRVPVYVLVKENK